MNFKKKILLLFILWICFSTDAVLGQSIDYHKEESPAVSWNGVPMFDARMLAAGGVSLMASRPFAASLNPALIPGDGKASFGVTYNYLSFQAYQYWGINQGVVRDPEPWTDNRSLFGGFSVSLPVKKLRLSAGWYLSHPLVLPDFNYDERYWRYTGQFNGGENTFFAAAAFKLTEKLDIGIKLDYISGKRRLEINEYHKYYISDGYPADSYLLMQRKEHHQLAYVTPGFGAAWKLSPSWTLAASLVYPLPGTVKRTLSREFDNLYDPPISENHSGKDTLYRPKRIHLGARYTDARHPESPKGQRIALAAEAVYTFWSGYRFVYFSETIPRDFNNTLVLALGVEYGIYSIKKDLTLRIGYRFDPQPVREPKTNLHALTAGTGFRFGTVTTNLGLAYYFSPYTDFKQEHIVVNGSLNIDL